MNNTIPPPPGGPQNKGPAYQAATWVFTTVAFFLVLTRVYVRIWLKCAFGWDDGMAVFAMALTSVSSGFTIPAVLAGYGQHSYYLSDGDINEARKWYFLASPLLIFSLAASKISICLLLLRILDKTRDKLKRWFLYVVIVILIVVAIPTTGYTFGQCHPVKKIWNPSTPGHCQHLSNFAKIGYLNGVINAIGDFALAMFPITFIKDLHLEIHKKVTLGVLMSCGVVCGMLTIARTVLTGDLTDSSDFTYRSFRITILSVTEENVSIIVSCVPTLGPAVELIDKKFKSFTSSHLSKQDHRLSRSHQRGLSIPLHPLPDLREEIRYEYSAAAAPNSHKDRQGSYESLRSLEPGIRKTTEVEIQRSVAG